MNEKEEWANEVLESFSGIERATPGDDLFHKILMELPEQEEHMVLSSHIGWVAMIASVVVGFNVYVLTLERTSNSDRMDSTHIESVYSLQSNFNIYTE